MNEQLTKDIARIKELLAISSQGPWERMEWGKAPLPYYVATTDGHYNQPTCLIARGNPTGCSGWPAITSAERIANADLIVLLRNNIEAILELLATAYAEGQQSTMKIVSDQSKKMIDRMEQGQEPLSYQQRVVLEKKELDDKIARLEAFIGLDKFSTLNDDERGRMHGQLYAMKTYSETLGERIAAFNTPPPATAPAPATPAEPVSEVRLSAMGQS